MANTMLFDDFDPSSVQEQSIKTLSNNNGKIVWLSHGDSNSRIVLQTRMLRTPTGIREAKKWDDSDDSPAKYVMELALDKDDPEYKKLEKFDNRIIELAMEAKSRWVKSKHYDRTSLENIYTPALRIPTDKHTGEPVDTWPPTLRVKVPRKDDMFVCEVWDLKRKPMDIAKFVENSRNAYISAIISCTGVWLGKGFGTTWKVEKILVHSTKSAPSSFSFIDTNETKLDEAKKEREEEEEEEAEGEGSGGSGANTKPRKETNEDEDYLDDSD